MGNIPLHLNCLCPIKNDDIKDVVDDIKKTVSFIEFRDIPDLNRRVEDLEKGNIQITKLENKIDRLEDKIEMRFEMLFLNMKINIK